MTTDNVAPPAPADLGPAGKALWTAHTTWSYADVVVELRPDELATLALAARTADTVDELEAAMEGEPPSVEGSRGQLIVHPLLVEIRMQRQALAALLARVNLPDGLDGGWEGLTASQRARKAARARWS